MSLAFDEPPTIEEKDCRGCGRRYPLVKSFVVREQSAVAITFAALHAHEGVREAWIDGVLGSFADEGANDRVTVGCRVGPVEGQEDPAASLVQAAEPYDDTSLWGRKLTRDEALVHPRLSDRASGR